MAQNLGSSADPAVVDAEADSVTPPEDTAFSAPALEVDFSACVAPMARR
jgi:hypothetical protein